MKGTLRAVFVVNKFVKYSLVLKLWGKNKIKYSPKSEGAFNILREDTAPGKPGDITLSPNHCAVKGASLQNILDHWFIFQELQNGILEGRVDSAVRGLQVFKRRCKILIFLLLFSFKTCKQFIFYSTIWTCRVIKLSKQQNCIFQHCKVC